MLTHRSSRTISGSLLAAVLGIAVFAGGAGAVGERVNYLRQVKPVLTERCVACHGVLKQNGGLRLDTAVFALKGGSRGPVIRPGNAAASALVRRVTAPDQQGRMPPEGDPLEPDEIAALRAWIAQGAKAPAAEEPQKDPRDHWAFRPVRRPPVPDVSGQGSGFRVQDPESSSSSPSNSGAHRGQGRGRGRGRAEPRTPRAQSPPPNPIDAFIAQRHRQKGLKPQPEAPPLVLVRRLYLDLIGLPPTPEEVDAFVAEYSNSNRSRAEPPNLSSSTTSSSSRPTPNAQRATPNPAYDRLVERLLADPRHGERWGRHWMDIWRYSDWWGLGDQLRNSQPHIWHWRDWLVEAVNADTPYDEMVRQMVAADELHPNDLKRLRATGFLARNYFLFNRNQWMEETVEHVSKGFLGLTVNCAKCHDHKYDPIPQADFYKLRAFFEPYHVRLDVVPGEPDLARDGIPRAFDGRLDTPTYLFVRGQESQPDKSAPLAPGIPSALAFKPLTIQPVPLPVEAWQPERRPWVVEAHLETARKGLAAARAALEKARGSGSNPGSTPIGQLAVEAARAELARVERAAEAMRAAWARADDGRSDPALEKRESETRIAAVRAEREAGAARARQAAAAAEERLRTAGADQKVAREKDLGQARAALEKADHQLSAPVGPEERFNPLAGAQWTATRFLFSGKDDPAVAFTPRSSGRRTALADWITDRRNPLTARVAVNHLWARHLGVPLVPTVFDFGRNGKPPTHPELLDWLAAELMEKGWSMKHLHRLIVTSAAYRMSSSTRGADANRARDPDNVHFWRREPVRLEAEAVRDAILALAGRLDPTMGGPPVLAPAQAASRRRSLYFFHSDTDRNLFLTTFDEAPVRECYRRDQSIVPQQALALSNGALVLDAAGPIAERLSSGGAGAQPLDDAAFIRRAFAVVLGIRPGAGEIAASQRALEAWRGQGPAGSDRAHFIWALLNHNDFVTLR